MVTALGLLLAAPIAWAGSSSADTVSCADDAEVDSMGPFGSGGHGVLLAGIAADLVFGDVASFVERADGTARLVGEVASETDPGVRFLVDVGFSGRIDAGAPNYPPLGSPKKELSTTAYVDAGGSVDPTTWHYYMQTQGHLVGLDDMAGAELFVTRMGPAFQVGPGASGKNVASGASGWLSVMVVTQPHAGPVLPQTTTGDLNVSLGEDCTFCAARADGDAFAQSGSGHAFYLPGIGSDFVFDGPAQFTEHSDGVARLSGVIVRASKPDESFLVEAEFSDRVDAGAAQYPPLGSPKIELHPTAYIENGGTVDTSSWHYYLKTEGTLTGRLAFTGALLTFDRDGPAFQVGAGASGKNVAHGASGWLDVIRKSNPDNGPSFPKSFKGDINVDVGSDCVQCVSEATPIASGTTHVLTIPGLGNDFVFSAGAGFQELPDGTARLAGVLLRASDPDAALVADVTFSDLLLPGDSSYPPQGSPKLELGSSSYVQAGGPIDPSTWRYYTATDGRLVGLGKLDGMTLDLSRKGPAFQVGRGANGKNLNQGASGWLDVATISSPTAGPTLPKAMSGDFNFDVEDCPTELIADAYGDGCPGTSDVVPRLRAFGHAQAGAPLALVLDRVPAGATSFLAIGTGRGLVPMVGPCELLAWPLVNLYFAPCHNGAPNEEQLVIQTSVPGVAGPWTLTLQAISGVPGNAMPATSNGLELRLP